MIQFSGGQICSLVSEAALSRIDFHHCFQLEHKSLAHVPLGIAFLYETCSNKPMNHVIELPDTHTSRGDPVFPGLNGQPCGFAFLYFSPEVMGFSGEKVALPENTTEQFLGTTGQVTGLE